MLLDPYSSTPLWAVLYVPLHLAFLSFLYFPLLLPSSNMFAYGVCLQSRAYHNTFEQHIHQAQARLQVP